MAIVYLSFQDISGQNRLTEETDFRDGFNVKMNPIAQEAKGENTAVISGCQWRQNIRWMPATWMDITFVFQAWSIPGRRASGRCPPPQ